MPVNEKFRQLVKMTGERAKLDAKANETYVVYLGCNWKNNQRIF